MNISDILMLTKAGFSAEQIGAMAQTQQPTMPPQQTGMAGELSPAMVMAMAGALGANQSNPLQDEINKLNAQMAELKQNNPPPADPLSDLTAKIDALEAKIDKIPLLSQSVEPASPTANEDPFAGLMGGEPT